MAQLQWCDLDGHDDFVHIKDFKNYFDGVINDCFTKLGRKSEIESYLKNKDEFMSMLKSDEEYRHAQNWYSSMPQYPYWVVKDIVKKIKEEKKNICPNDMEFLKKKFPNYPDQLGGGGGKLNKISGQKRSGHKRSGKSGHKRSGHKHHKSRRSTRRHRR